MDAYVEEEYYMDNNLNSGNNINNQDNGIAIAGMIVGIISLITCWVPIIPVVLGILGLVFGIKGYNASKTFSDFRGRGPGIAGMICGSIGLIISLFYTVIWIFAFIVYMIVKDDYVEHNNYDSYNTYNSSIISCVEYNNNENEDTILNNYRY